MRTGNPQKAQQRGMEMRSSKLTNRPFITLQCAAFAVLILLGAVRSIYQNGAALKGPGGAARFYSPGKIAGFAGLSSGGGTGILPRNALGRKTITRHMNGTLRLDTACLGILPLSRNIKDLRDFDQIGSRDILGKIYATGKVAALHAPVLAPRGLCPSAVRAPPRIAVACGHSSGDGSFDSNGGHISTPSFTCPLFSRGAHCPQIFSRLYIRAPPMPTLHS